MDISRMRMNGFASGMDIDEMVRKLMSASRIPMDKMKQQKQIMEWQREDYREMNKLILDLRNASSDMKLQKTYGSKSASYSGSAFTVTSSNEATEGIYKLKVNNLASAASLTSGDIVPAELDGGGIPIPGTGKGDINKKLSDLGLTSSTTLTITGSKGTSTVTVKPEDSLDLLMRTVNAKSSSTGVKLSYDPTLDRMFVTTTETGAKSSFSIKSADPGLLDNVLKFSSTAGATPMYKVTGNRTPPFTEATDKIDSTMTTEQTFRISDGVKNYDFKVDKATSLDQLMTMINTSDAGKAGVSAYLDANKQLAFTLPNNSYTFSDQTSGGPDLMAKLGLDTAAAPVSVAYEEISATGTDANVTFNNVTGSFSSNTFAINGMTFTLKETTTAPQDITVTQDTQGVFDSIKKYVEKYNETIEKINKELGEERFRSFQPLTAEQKEAMNEKDIERWEEKARSGIIRRDQTLESALNQFRSAFSNVVTGLPSGDLSRLADIGITTLEYSERGKLYIDEDKLKKALTDNPEQVMKLFTTDDGNKDSRSGDGIANRIHQIADDFYKRIVDKAGSAATTVLDSYKMGKRIKELDKRIESMEDRLVRLEDRYYKQFTAMESALSRMNSQSSYLAQQFGGGQ